MFSRNKSIIVLGCFLLLSLQSLLQVHCTVEEEPSSPPSEGKPAVAPGGGGGEGGAVGGRGGGSEESSGDVGFGRVPYTFTDSFGKTSDDGGNCNVTPLVVDTTEFDKLCGPHSDPLWPCFKHEDNSEDDLSFVTVEPWLAPLNMTYELVAKDYSFFTLRNASDAFAITYVNFGSVSLRYYDYEVDTGCFKIHLEGNKAYRIHVSTTNRDYRDIDTMNYRSTGKRLCNKWVTIATRKRDADSSMHSDDNRGI
ncbi:probable Mig1 protein, induced during biotrophic phase [Sporisorium reilianum f. sp. reilianum]|uniref:Probable Mig1 protein, induced during biotrophic phase n=1 Tax=Sporisorium reilianum f. sp. reilianum TaxID=72559 RepID=A0A2N8UES4_9BASI|nr:probable Mig1 protein, induced during biotrophic phase [Sporisorium reilianum f. sp. reilianum]